MEIQYLLTVLVIYCWPYFSIFCHEMGHFTFAKLVGVSPYLVKIGEGNKIFQLHLFNAVVEFHFLPYSGLTYVDILDPNYIKLKTIFLTIGGPFANFILILGISCIVKITGNEQLLILILMEIILLIFNLIPRNIKINGKIQPNDGKLIYSAITTDYKKYFYNAFEEYKKILLRYEDKEKTLPKTFLNHDIKILLIFIAAQNKLAQGYIEEAVKLLLEILDFEKISQLDRVLILDHLACTVAINGYKKYLNDADQWSKQSLEIASYSTTLKGTRGAILIELGRYDEGKQLLLPLTEPENDDIDIAVSSCYIAKAEYFLGNIETVNDWFVKANEIGVADSILKRIQQEINYS